MTQVIAIPLRDREADALRRPARDHPGVDQDRQRTVVSVGPLGVVSPVRRETGAGCWPAR